MAGATPCFLLISLLISSCLSVVPLEGWISGGQASYHVYVGSGANTACGYINVDNYLATHSSAFPYGYVTAVGTSSNIENLFDGGKGCGACYEIKCLGPWNSNPDCDCFSNTVIVQAIDLSGANTEPHFDIAEAGFGVVAEMGCGRISIDYRQVSCEFTENIYMTTDANSAWSFYMNFYNVAGDGRLCEVELQSSGSSDWMQCVWTGSKWKCDDSALEPTTLPLTFRITDCIGNTITGENIVNSFDSSQFDFGKNFAISQGTPQPTTPTANPVTPAPTSTDNNTPAPTPTQPTTPAPTGSGGGIGCVSDNICVKVKGFSSTTPSPSSPVWWWSIYDESITNSLTSGCSISDCSAIEVKHSTSNTWVTASNENNDCGISMSEAFTSTSVSVDFRITSTTNQVLIGNSVVQSTASETEWDFGSNFGSCGSDVTPSPVTPSPVTSSPITPAPVTPSPITITDTPVNTQTPTVKVTQTPTSKETPSPISAGGSPGTITTKSGSGAWYYTFSVALTTDDTIESAGAQGNEWEDDDWAECSFQTWTTDGYACSSGSKAFDLPLTIMIKSKGGTVSYTTVTDLTVGEEWEMGSFDSAVEIGIIDPSDGLTTTEYISIILIVLFGLIIIGLILYCIVWKRCIKNNNVPKGDVSFNKTQNDDDIMTQEIELEIDLDVEKNMIDVNTGTTN